MLRSGLTRIDLRLGTLTQWLNVLGMPGMTAYFGLLDVGQPSRARPWWSRAPPARWGRPWASWPSIKGCRVVGIAGGAGQVRVGGEGTGLRRLHRLQGRQRGRTA
jgi:NADPH-dependent curcumin reductase CurA